MLSISERSYECVGQWEEAGTVLAYARLLSSATSAWSAVHECFVGAVDSAGRLFLMESGADCRRGLRVTALGMQLKRRSKDSNLLTKYYLVEIYSGFFLHSRKMLRISSFWSKVALK